MTSNTLKNAFYSKDESYGNWGNRQKGENGKNINTNTDRPNGNSFTYRHRNVFTVVGAKTKDNMYLPGESIRGGICIYRGRV